MSNPDTWQRLEQAHEEGGRDLVAVYLAGDHLTNLPRIVTDKVFAKAWEDGHASGVHEVEQQYEEIAEIVKAAFEAGAHAQLVKDSAREAERDRFRGDITY